MCRDDGKVMHDSLFIKNPNFLSHYCAVMPSGDQGDDITPEPYMQIPPNSLPHFCPLSQTHPR